MATGTELEPMMMSTLSSVINLRAFLPPTVGSLVSSSTTYRTGSPATEVGSRGMTLATCEPNEDPGPVELRSEEHTSELQSRENLVCRLLLEKKNHLKLPLR